MRISEVEEYKQQFIEFLAQSGALQGERTLKSGRTSPYFINSGMFNDGESLGKLGEAYAAAINANLGQADYDVIFGPAYKGITLASEAVGALYRQHQIKKLFSYNRKEVKEHGSKGILVGHNILPGEKIVIVDDVFTTGGTKYEMLELLASLAPEASVVGLLICVDRMESGADGEDAIGQFVQKTGVPVLSIVTIREIVSHLHGRDVSGTVYIDDSLKEKIEAYLKEFGVEQRKSE